MGNCICLKLHLQDFRYARISGGQVLASETFKSFSEPVYRKLKLEASRAAYQIVKTEYQDALLYAIIEMPTKIENPIEVWEKVEFELSGGRFDHFRSLPHPIFHSLLPISTWVSTKPVYAAAFFEFLPHLYSFYLSFYALYNCIIN
jgi:hypothetical protein